LVRGWSGLSAIVVDCSFRRALPLVWSVVPGLRIAAVTKFVDCVADGAEVRTLAGLLMPARLDHRVKPATHWQTRHVPDQPRSTVDGDGHTHTHVHVLINFVV